MTKRYNWGGFYQALGCVAPQYLQGLDSGLLAYVADMARNSDDFWFGLEGTLDANWDQDPKVAVRRTLQQWTWNVRRHLEEVYGVDSLLQLPVRERRRGLRQAARVRLRVEQALIGHLLDAALAGEGRGASGVVLVVQGIITPYRKTAEGHLVRSVGEPWLQVLRMLRTRWECAFEISPMDWEQIVAAAFDYAGYDEVTLTPRSGDHGRDVIAVRRGVGCVRIIGSVKAYSPNRRVGHDDVRALAGVLLGDQRASKGIVATTSDFAPRIESDPFLSPLIPYRLELMNGTRLRAWLSDLLVTRPVLAPVSPVRNSP
jgi:restriction system protein